MAKMTEQDRALFTADEFALIQSSLPSHIGASTPRRLNTQIARARKLSDKYRDLVREQQRKTKKTPQPGRPRPFSNLRTKRKAQMFAGALERFERRLKQLSRRAPGAKSPSKRPRRPVSQRQALRKKKQQRQAANESAVSVKATRQFQKSRLRAIQGHIRVSGARRQGKRDAR